MAYARPRDAVRLASSVRRFYQAKTPLEFLISMVNAPDDRASFLTNMRFIKDVLGVAV